MQYIVICLDDHIASYHNQYVQATGKRFLDEEEAIDYMKRFALSRNPVVVPVPEVELDEKGYPSH